MTHPFYVTASEAVDTTHLMQQGNGFVIGVFTADGMREKAAVVVIGQAIPRHLTA